MSFQTKALYEQRGQLVEQMKNMVAAAAKENRSLSAEEQVSFNKIDADQESLKSRIEDIKKVEALDSELRSVPTAKADEVRNQEVATKPDAAADWGKGLRAWFLQPSHLGGTTPQEWRDAAGRVGIGLHSKQINLRLSGNAPRSLAEARQLTTQTSATGGYTVPTTLVKELEVALLAYNGVRQAADVLRTDSGENLNYPTANDTSNSGALISENTAANDSTDPSFGQVTFYGFTFTSKIIRVPFQLLQDNKVDLEKRLGEMLGVRIGRVQNTYMTTGSGSSQPQGIVNGSTNTITAAALHSIAYSDLVKTYHSLDPAYRDQASWMLHDNTLSAIKQITDSYGRPLWVAGLADGQPDKLMGKPFFINQAMAQLGVGTHITSVLFGDMKKYMIRDVGDVQLIRLDERYADLGQVAFVAWVRGDGRVLDAGTHPIMNLSH